MNLADQFLSLAGCNVRLNKKKRVISDEARAASIKSKKLAKWKRYEEVFGEPGTILDTTSFSRKSGVASANQVLRSLEQDGKVELVGKEDTPGGQERYKDRIDTELYPPHVVLPNKYPAHLARMGVMFRLPIVDLTTGEVFDILKGEHNPLYDEGFERVGCFPCLAAGDAHKSACFQHDATGAKHFALVKTVEERTGKSVWTSKHGKSKYEDQGCLLCSI